jgi:hypothetical protein
MDGEDTEHPTLFSSHAERQKHSRKTVESIHEKYENMSLWLKLVKLLQ